MEDEGEDVSPIPYEVSCVILTDVRRGFVTYGVFFPFSFSFPCVFPQCVSWPLLEEYGRRMRVCS